MTPTNLAKSGTETLKVIETRSFDTKFETEFMIEGEATINLWGGGTGTIQMDTTHFNTNGTLTMEDIANNLNDGQFGCESIASADVMVRQLLIITRDYLDSNNIVIDTTNSIEWVEVFEGVVIPDRTQGFIGLKSLKKAS